jgi:hypothetical protein
LLPKDKPINQPSNLPKPRIEQKNNRNNQKKKPFVNPNRRPENKTPNVPHTPRPVAPKPVIPNPVVNNQIENSKIDSSTATNDPVPIKSDQVVTFE